MPIVYVKLNATHKDSFSSSGRRLYRLRRQKIRSILKASGVEAEWTFDGWEIKGTAEQIAGLRKKIRGKTTIVEDY